MARTNRNTLAAAPAASTNVDALDNIDLDDMFADDLFAGLEIDLDNMDDIAGDNTLKADSSHSRQAASISISIELKEDVVAKPPSTRRTVKRKSRNPSDDEDSYYKPPSQPLTKRSKSKGGAPPPAPVPTVKASITNNKSRTKSKAGSSTIEKSSSKNTKMKEERHSAVSLSKEQSAGSNNKSSTSATTKASSTTSKSKFGLRATGNALPMMSSQSGAQRMLSAPTGVAAAGQFGGRHLKRAASAGVSTLTNSVLPKSSGLTGASKNKLPLAMRSSSQSSATNPLSDNLKKSKQQQQSKQQQEHQIAPKTSSSLPTSQQPSLMKQKAKHISPKREYCGLRPSDTIFYPFMSALPAESLKSRKSYGIIDKLHSTLLNYLSNPTKYNSNTNNKSRSKNVIETDPIFQLLLEAYKSDEKQSTDDNSIAGGSKTSNQKDNILDVSNSSSKIDVNKNEVLGNAISALRKTAITSDKDTLIDDLLSVVSLLQKQHDFLAQNCANMQQWCLKNMNDADYRAVFKSKQPDGTIILIDNERAEVKPTVLESFRRRDVKVKIICDGFKEPPRIKNNNSKSASSLPVALLPPRYAPPPPPAIISTDKHPAANNKVQGPPTSSPSGYSNTNKSKKRKLSISSPSGLVQTDTKPSMSTTTSSVAIMKSQQPPPPITYSTVEPEKRRECITNLISKTARELEMNYIHRVNAERKQWLDRHDFHLRRFFETEDNIHNQQQHPESQQLLPITTTADISKNPNTPDAANNNTNGCTPITMIHTTGMWRYMDRSGYAPSLTQSDIQQRLNEIHGDQEPSITAIVASNKSSKTGGRIRHRREDPNAARNHDPYSGNKLNQSPRLRDNLDNAENHDAHKPSLLDRLQSLLIEEDDDDDEDEEDNVNNRLGDKADNIGESDNNENHDKNNKSSTGDTDFDIIEEIIDLSSEECVDLSALTFDERAFLHIRGFGLAKKLSLPSQLTLTLTARYDSNKLSCHSNLGGNIKENRSNEASESVGSYLKVELSSAKKQQGSIFSSNNSFVAANHRNEEHTNGTKKCKYDVNDVPELSSQALMDRRSTSRRPSELECVIDSMTTDLTRVEGCNIRRSSYLEAITTACSHLTVEDSKRRKEEDAGIIAKCRNLLLKSKAETMKAKSESKSKSNSDDLQLPW